MGHFLHSIVDFLRSNLPEHALGKALISMFAFAAGVFIRGPVERWWKNRGSLRLKRASMYAVLADIDSALDFYATGMSLVDRELSWTPRAESLAFYVCDFYEKINPTKYQAELRSLRVPSVRMRMPSEVDGFERIMGMVTKLPQSTAALEDNVTAISRLYKDFKMSLRLADFDSKSLQIARRARAQTDLKALQKVLKVTDEDLTPALKELQGNIQGWKESRRAALEQLNESEQKRKELEQRIKDSDEYFRALGVPLEGTPLDVRAAEQPLEAPTQPAEFKPTDTTDQWPVRQDDPVSNGH